MLATPEASKEWAEELEKRRSWKSQEGKQFLTKQSKSVVEYCDQKKKKSVVDYCNLQQ